MGDRPWQSRPYPADMPNRFTRKSRDVTAGQQKKQCGNRTKVKTKIPLPDPAGGFLF